MNARDKLLSLITRKKSMLLIGIDPDPSMLPDTYGHSMEDIHSYLEEVIDVSKGEALGFKFQLAHFLSADVEGLRSLKDLVYRVAGSSYIILDGKFGDVPSTMKFYRRFAFERLNVDAVTLNPYTGIDTVKTFSMINDKMVFVLVHTSNEGSRDFQEIYTGDIPLYAKVAKSLVAADSNKNIGMVVGATFPEVLKETRSIAHGIPFLIPGIGFQGGSVEKAMQYSMLEKGDISLLSMSRSILYGGGAKYREHITSEIARVNNICSHYITA